MVRAATEDDIRRIYNATIDGLYGFVASRCDGDRDLAEDITQETWLRAVRAWHAKGIPDQPLAWLTTVSRNIVVNHFSRRPPDALELSAAESVMLENSDATVARRSLVARALARLSVQQARLLDAFHFKRQRIADIAAAHGISERAVEGRLRRARQELRHHIESDPDSEGDLP